MPNPIPVHTGDRCSTSRTNSGTMAARTPTAAKPSARLAAAAARNAPLRSAPASAANGRAGRCSVAWRFGASLSPNAAMTAGITSSPP